MGGVFADENSRELFSFTTPTDSRQWQPVNDGVMGGRSVGQFEITNDETMKFFGTLSLKNNGGFASVRSRASKLNLTKGDQLVMRVRGDGRNYTFNLYVPTRRIAFSYREEFETKKDEWVEVVLPLEQFKATSFGRELRNQSLDPATVSGIGILLGDKKEGPFVLEIDWIKVQSGSE
ncbi:MAG: CIA30 family protein [Rhodospirillaceae bacterium]|nr:CIA30 family protein [Rhodospirillaceae bacterium]